MSIEIPLLTFDDQMTCNIQACNARIIWELNTKDNVNFNSIIKKLIQQ
jgi:hypothetical protein